MMKSWPENMEYWDDGVEEYTYLIDLVVRFIKSFTIRNIYGIVPSKTMEGLCQEKAEDQN